MPYARLRFSPAGAVEQAIAAAAERFQQHSPFLSQLGFHEMVQEARGTCRNVYGF